MTPSLPVAAVVWDWNGTLLDDLAAAVRSINIVLSEFGLSTLADVEAYRAVFGFPVARYYERLGFDLSQGGNFEAAAHRFIDVYGVESTGAPLQEGVRDTLALLHRDGIRQVVVSATEHRRLTAQMAPYDLDAWLEAAYGIEDIYARSKAHIAARWLADSGLDPASVVFVGDSDHDHEIAVGLGARSVLYAGGHHARSHLEGRGVPVVEDLRAVAPLVRER